MRDELFIERETQIAEKMSKHQEDQEIEHMYAELWEQDRLAKAKREEQEAQEQMERNREMVEVNFDCYFNNNFNTIIF